MVGAASTIAQTGESPGRQAIALAIFVLIGTIGTAAPVILYFAMAERSTQMLDELRSWMAHNSNTIMTVICLIIGAKLIGDGISGF